AAKLVCADCGGYFGRKVWSSYKGDKSYRKEIWRCNDKYKRLDKPGKGCQTLHITEDEIMTQFLIAFNRLISDWDGLIEDCRLAQSVLCDTTALDAERADWQRELAVVSELYRKAISENARTTVNQAEWKERNNTYLERHRKALERIEGLEVEKSERLGKVKTIKGFIKDIESRPLAVTEFDEKLWLALIDIVTVGRNGTMTFRFKNGSEIIV
ncbi:MAG: recombinase zinc beta ribbon domain-containing protein, partial [Sporomusaceae bacterium]|nr:recombinase zinc beta ribbon domain-containing protein [Sporomusaceae bacterium]